MKLPFVLTLVALTSCQSDETISGYIDPESAFTLIEMDDTPFDGRATIQFPRFGTVSGMAPCNTYGARQTAPYPWFKLTELISTETACEDLVAELRYFNVLTNMTLAEVSGPNLILSNDAGQRLVFLAAP